MTDGVLLFRLWKKSNSEAFVLRLERLVMDELDDERGGDT
jgi:hypothetical protein